MGRTQFLLSSLAVLSALATGTDSPGGSLRRTTVAAEVPQSSDRPAPSGFLSRQPLATDVTTAEVEGSLISELAGNVSSERLAELEAALRPMYIALPKGEAGNLGHQAVRYALHRLLLQRHGWFIVGLEPTTEVLPPYLHGDWVPEYLQGLLEQRLGGRGINLQEVAALAASLEDLVSAEAARRLDLVYSMLRVPKDSRLDGAESDRVLETYMMMYLDDGNFTSQMPDLDLERKVFKSQYTNWDAASSWMEKIKEQQLQGSGDGKLGHTDMAQVAGELGKRFGAFNDGECHSLKQEFISMEGSKAGRVSLLDFYKKGLYSHWEFNEKVDYLRAIGALDESDPSRPLVILPNYMAARTNCLTASSLYSVCCRNECEDLVGHLEAQIAAPTASAERVLELVSGLASDTANASRTLPDSLVQRLGQIAARHGGQVPLHGRLFAQWMHHAYPRECPFPHEGGKNPLTPDEWMREAGEEEARVSEAEVRQLLGACANAGAGGPCNLGTPAREEDADPEELPWSDVEVMLTTGQLPVRDTTAWVLGLKICLLLVLGPVVAMHTFKKSAQGGEAKLKVADPEGATEDEPLKPGKEQPYLQRWQVITALLGVGLLLETLGILDRTSFICTLVGGLLLNVVLPQFLRHASQSNLKPGKCI